MASLKHNTEYILTKIAVVAVNLLTDKWADKFASALGRLGYILIRSRRHIALDNLRHALGYELDERQLSSIAGKVFQNIAKSLIETARFGRIGPEGVRHIVYGDGEKYLRQARDHGKGAILLTAHFGNWELLGGWVASSGYPIDLLVGVQHNPKTHRLFNDFRRELGSGIIEVSTSTLREVFKSLKANKVIGYAADQHAPAQNLVLDFMGRKAAIATGPAQFAVRTGCVILPMMLRREAYDRHILIAAEPIFPPDSGDYQKDILTITQTYLKFWEDVIRKNPDQWMWTHRRWKI